MQATECRGAGPLPPFCLKALAKRPQARYPSCQALAGGPARLVGGRTHPCAACGPAGAVGPLASPEPGGGWTLEDPSRPYLGDAVVVRWEQVDELPCELSGKFLFSRSTVAPGFLRASA